MPINRGASRPGPSTVGIARSRGVPSNRRFNGQIRMAASEPTRPPADAPPNERKRVELYLLSASIKRPQSALSGSLGWGVLLPVLPQMRQSKPGG